MKIIVIGAGLIGMTSAWFLARSGHNVTVIDRAEAAGMETSYANASMLTASHSRPWNNPGVFRDLIRWFGRADAPILIRPTALPRYAFWGIKFIANSTPVRYRENCRRNHQLGVHSLDMMRLIRETDDIDYDRDTSGVLTIYRDEKSFDEAASHPLNAILNLDLDILDVQQLVQREPALEPVSTSLMGGIHHKTDESGNAHKFCQALQRILSARQVEFVFETEVTAFRGSKDRIDAVVTNQGELNANLYVLAAASYSPILSRKLGFSLPVKPAKGYSLTCPHDNHADSPNIPVIDDHLHAAIAPVGDILRVGGTAEFTGYNLDLSPERIDNLHRLLAAVYPNVAASLDPSSTVPWTGLRPMSADGVPIIGETPIQNLLVNTGHGQLGWTFAAASGRLIADIVNDEPSEIDPADYALAGR